MDVGTVVWIEPGLDSAEPGGHYPNLRAETLDRELAWAREFGFAGLQIGWRGDAPVEPESVGRACERHGIEVVAISAYTDFLTPEHHWPCRDLAAVERMIAAAPALGTDTAVTWGGFGDSADTAQRAVVRDALDAALRCAESHGVQVALELYDQCVVGTVEQINALADELGSARLGVMMDPPNTMTEADLADLPGYYARLMTAAGCRLFRAHAKGVRFEAGQRTLPGPGEGQQDYAAYLRALREAGFDGCLLVEHVTRQTVGPATAFVKAKIAEALG